MIDVSRGRFVPKSAIAYVILPGKIALSAIGKIPRIPTLIMKRIIVGTAGHIDHGKTSLVKALTGVDADRLKEEKERGITIDIGFADLTVGDVHFGFVDVPGHERFVKNMLAGAHGIDLVMLVVAADESVMPQTREHFDICRLLEVKSGLIVITKADLVDEELLQLVEAEVADFVAGSFLEGAPVLRVSSRTGAGVDGLKKTLSQLAAKARERDENAVARMPIDRAFTIKGFGTVVTGTLIAGRIRAGDELEILPPISSSAASPGRRARARGLQVHGKSTQEALAGERVAVNLQGIDLAEVERGQTLAPAGRLRTSSMLDGRLRLLDSATRGLRARSRVRLHIGAAEVLARVVPLGRKELTPGESCFAQLRLETPTLAMPGDHFIVRAYSPVVTIGGGVVIDALPSKHRLREAAQAASWLEKLEAANEVERVALLVEMAGERGMGQDEIAARSGSSDEVIKRAAESVTKSRRAMTASQSPKTALTPLIARPAFEELAGRVRATLKEFHRKSPLESGMGREEIREKIFARLPPDIFRAVIANLVERNEAVAEKDLLRLSSHRVALSVEEQAAKDRLAALFAEAGLQPMPLEDAIARSGVDAARAQRFAQMLFNSGELVRVAGLVFHRSALDGLRETLRRFKAEHGPRLDVMAFKDLTGVSRKYAIPLLEYLDLQRVTRRSGEVREIL
jgi:selenocysteine-specific elongation factor